MRQDMQHCAIATDEATEDEASGGAGDQHIAIERLGKALGRQWLSP